MDRQMEYTSIPTECSLYTKCFLIYISQHRVRKVLLVSSTGKLRLGEIKWECWGLDRGSSNFVEEGDSFWERPFSLIKEDKVLFSLIIPTSLLLVTVNEDLMPGSVAAIL